MNKKRIEWLAKQLSEHFGPKQVIECCCEGMGCYNTGCFQWWQQFLKKYNYKDIERMVKAYRIIRKEE